MSRRRMAPILNLGTWSIHFPSAANKGCKAVLISLTILAFKEKRPTVRYMYSILSAVPAFVNLIALLIQLHHLLSATVHPRITFIPALVLVQTVAAFVLCLDLLLVPRRPDVEYDGTPIDRQNSVSALTRWTIWWARDALKLARLKSSLRVEDLPGLHYRVRSKLLLSWFGESTSVQRYPCWTPLGVLSQPEHALHVAPSPTLMSIQVIKRAIDAFGKPCSTLMPGS